ncbi:hypothetical protein AOQ84DRAFT_377027 [Glonium stellatum]|uniref:Uncharacterized protein n=1 Tax=Glonium stellatum TaxID=574774 RepID=A0A8E2F073_9PEZI|nr:hypothetical protein AOQ84DRAFT_377027 [Glonium stellatum]
MPLSNLPALSPLAPRLHLRNRNSTRSALAACGIMLLVLALSELRCTHDGCLTRTGFSGDVPKSETSAASDWGPKMLAWGGEAARGGLALDRDREGEAGGPFGVGGKEFASGAEDAVGAAWQFRLGAEGGLAGEGSAVGVVGDGGQGAVMPEQLAGGMEAQGVV